MRIQDFRIDNSYNYADIVEAFESGNMCGRVRFFITQDSMDCFWCETITGKLVLKEAEAAKWLSKDELGSVQWLPANLALIEKIGMRLEKGE